MKKIFLIALLASISTFNYAQKIVYTNSMAILAEMPEVKRADANLETLQKQLLKRKETMVQAYQAKISAAMERDKNGTLSPKEAQDLEKQLADEQQKIMDYDQDVQKQLLDKRKLEIEPILKRVQTAIDQVAKEKGCDYVIDSSTSVLLYAKDGNDITPAVKAKLGMPATAGK